MALIKKSKNYDEIRHRLDTNEDIRLNMVLLLMEIKPYRRSIFNQIENSKHEIHKLWTTMSYEDKIMWIKDKMFTKWSKQEFIDHIIKSIKTLRFNKTINQSFDIILETY